MNENKFFLHQIKRTSGTVLTPFAETWESTAQPEAEA